MTIEEGQQKSMGIFTSILEKSEGLQKIEMGAAIQEGVRNPTAAELIKPTQRKRKKEGDNMNSYQELQNFYKESHDLEKAQKVKNPWAVARSIVDGTAKGDWWQAMWGDQINPEADEEEKRSIMGKIVAGIEANKWNKMLKSEDVVLQKKLSPAMGALAGWWLGGEIQGIISGNSAPTAAQQREFERQVQRQMRRGMKKDISSLEQLQTHYADSNDTYIKRTPIDNGLALEKEASYIKTGAGSHLSIPPRPGEVYNAQTHRWQKRENMGQVYQSSGGQKRHRSLATGASGSKSVSGHGKGQQRETYAGRKGVERGERLEPGHKVKETSTGKEKKDANQKEGSRTKGNQQGK